MIPAVPAGGQSREGVDEGICYLPPSSLSLTTHLLPPPRYLSLPPSHPGRGLYLLVHLHGLQVTTEITIIILTIGYHSILPSIVLPIISSQCLSIYHRLLVLWCRKTNYGTRIDYILCSCGLASRLSRTEVWPHVMGSDHCPVMADLPSLSLTPAPSEPSLSLHILLGRQTTLSSFIGTTTTTPLEVKSHTGVTKRSSGKGVKRKLSKTAASIPAEKSHKTLDSFFNTSSSTIKTTSKFSDTGSGATERPCETGSGTTTTTTPSSSQLSGEWSSLLCGPPRPPLCGRHREPATLRMVRKMGLTRGRQFWVCSRPAGSKTDPDTQCDFFQWLTITSSRGRGKNSIT